MADDEIKLAVKKLDLMIEIKELLSKIDDKLEDLKYILGAKAVS